MKLGPTNRLLFGKTPRFVGLVGSELPPKQRDQFVAFDRGLLKMFLERNHGENNMYTRVSHIGETSASVVDKIFLDFDAEKPNRPEHELFREMREDRAVADNILGDVVEDVRAVAEWIEDMGWPAVGVFSGMGVHIHILTKERPEPTEHLRTTAKKIESEAGLSTLDNKGTKEGDFNRLCRLVNAPRIGSNGEPLRVYTIPLELRELADTTPEELLELSMTPRQIELPRVKEHDRPELRIWQDYKTSSKDDDVALEAEPLSEQTLEVVDGELEKFVKEALQMPCMYERLMSRNPDHSVRFNSAILFFNLGLTPDEVQDIYSRLGWFDYDPEITSSILNQIYEKGYASMSCQTLQERGLCKPGWDTVEERKENCDCFGWEGGDCDWK